MPNIFKTIGGAIKHVAPLLGKVVETVGGPAASIGIGIVKNALGIPDATNEELEDRVQSLTAADLFAIRQAEQQHYETLYALDTQDRADARNLAIQKGIIVQAVLSAVFVIIYAVVTWYFMQAMLNPSEVSVDLLGQFGMVFGVLSAGVVQVMNFWFGSSAGSKAKTDQQHAVALRNGG
jgi:hypothetical protein